MAGSAAAGWTGRPAAQPATEGHFSVRGALGEGGWLRLPPAVRLRFADAAQSADYLGSFAIVRASRAGRLLGQLCRLIGTPVTPWVGVDVPATVHVRPDGRGGIRWERLYHFPGHRACRVTSTKCAGDAGELIERLPCGLRMSLDVYESGGALHFMSTGYHLRLGRWRVPVPRLLPPGTTHVEHHDEGGGWFRFTMTVSHALLGEVFYQTGRFRAASESP